MILRIVSRPLIAVIFYVAFCAPAFAADNYQTDIGPTPKNGRQGASAQGRGTVLATLDDNKFSLQGKFWDVVGILHDNFNTLGFAIVGIFAVAWAASYALYRFRRLDRMEA